MPHATINPTQYSVAAGPVQAEAKGTGGGSIVDFLNKQGQDSSVSARAQLAFERKLVQTPEEFIALAREGQNADLNTQLLAQLQAEAQDAPITQAVTTAGANQTQAAKIAEAIRTGNVNEFGVPKNLGEIFGNVLKVPTPTTPIDAASLSKDASGEQNLNDILSAALNDPDPSTSIAGLLSLFDAQTAESKALDESNTELIKLLQSTGEQGPDLERELEEQGVTGNIEQVKQLNLEAAQLKGEIDAFDVETQKLLSDIEGQPIPTGLISGRQGELAKARRLEKMALTAELSAVIGLGLAYQGNAELGLKLAKQAVDLKYAPIFNSIEVLKTQIGIASAKLDKKDATRANIINTLIDIKFDQISEQRDKDKELEAIRIEAAAAGAPTSLLDAALASGDPVRASSILNEFIKVSGEGDGDGSDRFSTTQENKGIANAGTDQATFRAYDEETQNYFINGDVSGTKSDIDKALEDFSLEEVLETIDQFEVNDIIKQFFRDYAEGKAPEEQSQEEQFNSFIQQLKDQEFTRAEAKKALMAELSSKDNFNGVENIPQVIKDKVDEAVQAIYGKTLFQKVFAPGGRE